MFSAALILPYDTTWDGNLPVLNLKKLKERLPHILNEHTVRSEEIVHHLITLFSPSLTMADSDLLQNLVPDVYKDMDRYQDYTIQYI